MLQTNVANETDLHLITGSPFSTLILLLRFGFLLIPTCLWLSLQCRYGAAAATTTDNLDVDPKLDVDVCDIVAMFF